MVQNFRKLGSFGVELPKRRKKYRLAIVESSDDVHNDWHLFDNINMHTTLAHYYS